MSAKKKNLFYISTIIILIVIIVLFVIFPTFNEIKDINDAIETERIDLEKEYMRSLLYKEVVIDFDKIKSQQEKIGNLFVASGQELDFITSLEKIAESNNVKQEIKLAALPESESITAKLHTQDVQLIIQGNFSDVFGYLSDLNRLESQINLHTFSFTSDHQNKNIVANLTGTIYVLPAQ